MYFEVEIGLLTLLLLLSYHRRLRMISEVIELYVECGRVSHSWCMCWGQGWRWWMVCMQDKAGGLVTCQDMLEHFPSSR